MKIKKSLLIQGSILAFAGIITKIIGFVYRIPMANILGNTGNGLYSVAFGIYNIALTISSYGMPVSISKLIAEKLGENKKKDAELTFKIALLLSLIMGLMVSLGLYIGAKYLAIIFDKKGLELPLKILAPTTFIVSILGCFRGYHQGFGDMIPTSVSQIVEQIVNAIVSIVAAYEVVLILKVNSNKAAYKAAGGTLGTLCGAFAGLVIVFVFYYIKRNKKHNGDKLKLDKSQVSIAKNLLLIMFPIMLSQTVYQIGFTLDDLIFANLMKMKNINSLEVTNLQGVFNTQYTQFINLPVAIATAFGVSVIPLISNKYAKKDYAAVEDNINQLLRITLWIVIPSAIGLSLTSSEIMKVLFPNLGTYIGLASKLLMYGSVSCVFYSLGTISTNILQGIGRVKIPVINSLISLVIHIIVVCYLLIYTNLGVYVLLIGDICFPLLIGILNFAYIIKNMKYKVKCSSFLLRIVVASLIMGIVLILIDIIFRNYNILILLIVKIIMGIIAYLFFFVEKNEKARLSIKIK